MIPIAIILIYLLLLTKQILSILLVKRDEYSGQSYLVASAECFQFADKS